MVLFLHKPPDGIEDYDRDHPKTPFRRPWPAELILAKNRNGEVGIVRLDWMPEFTRFECWNCAENAPNCEPAFA